MLDYSAIKTLAKSIKRPVTALLALSQQNDPFYAGMGSRRRDAEWFAGIWSAHGGTGAHLRRLHYRLISSAPPIRKPDGSDYQNTENDWQLVGSASLAARYLGLVPFDGLIDRRNDEPMIFASNLSADPEGDLSAGCDTADSEPEVERYGFPDMPSLPSYTLSVDQPVQNHIVEVWIEKSTQNDWLLPLCRRRGVNLVVGIGEQSEIRSRQLAMRAAQYGAPIRIIYLSDFDPAGRSMPKAVARKVEFTIAKHDLKVDLQLIPLVLSPDQCREYRLPRTPIKETERRRDKFETTFGVGATELDALEALHPGEMARLLEAEFRNWLDDDLGRRAQRLESELQMRLSRLERGIYTRYADEIDIAKKEFREIVRELNAVDSQFTGWQERTSALWGQIAADLAEQRPYLSEVVIPRSEAPGVTERFVLFDSKRDYLTQMDAYNAWRDGDETGSDN